MRSLALGVLVVVAGEAMAQPLSLGGVSLTTVGRSERGSSAWRVLPLDVTEDGCQEMVGINGGDQYPQELVIYRDGCKVGTVNSRVLVNEQHNARFVDVEAAHLDDDSRLDLLAAVFMGDDYFPTSGFQGAGIRYALNGTQKSPATLGGEWLFCGAAVRDFAIVDSDSDGVLELLVVGEAPSKLDSFNPQACTPVTTPVPPGDPSARLQPLSMNLFARLFRLPPGLTPISTTVERHYFMALWDLKLTQKKVGLKKVKRWQVATQKPRWKVPLPGYKAAQHVGAPTWVRAFDFNNDGFLDVAGSFEGVGTIFVLGQASGLPVISEPDPWTNLPACTGNAIVAGRACMDKHDGLMSYSVDIARLAFGNNQEGVRLVDSRGCFADELKCQGNNLPNRVAMWRFGDLQSTTLAAFPRNLMPTGVLLANLCPGAGPQRCASGSRPGVYFGLMVDTFAVQNLQVLDLQEQPAPKAVDVKVGGSSVPGWLLDFAIVDRQTAMATAAAECSALRAQTAITHGPVVTITGIGPFRIKRVCSDTAEIPPCARADKKNALNQTFPQGLCWRASARGRMVQVVGGAFPPNVWIDYEAQSHNDVVAANAMPTGMSYVVWNPKP